MEQRAESSTPTAFSSNMKKTCESLSKAAAFLEEEGKQCKKTAQVLGGVAFFRSARLNDRRKRALSDQGECTRF